MGEVLPKMGQKLIIDKDSSWVMPFVLPNRMNPLGTAK